MFCTNCGKELEDGTLFCTECGTKLEGSEPAPEINEQPVETVPEVNEALEANEAPAEPAFTVAESAPTPETPAPKKKNGKKIAIAIAIPVIVIAVAAVLCFTVFSDLMMKTFASPEVYYAYIENENVDELADDVSSFYEDYLEEYNELSALAQKGEFKIELGDSARSLIAAAGLDLSWLEDVTIAYDVNTKGSAVQTGMSLLHGDSSIAALDMYLDTSAKEAFISLPGIVDEFCTLPVSGSGFDMNVIIAAMPNEDVLEQLIGRYGKIIVKNVTDVEKSSETLKVGDLSEKCTVLTVKLSNETLYNIVKEILETAKTDKQIKTIVEDFAVVYEDIQRASYEELESIYKEIYADNNVYADDPDFSITKEIGTFQSYLGYEPGKAYDEFIEVINSQLADLENHGLEDVEDIYLKNYVNSDGKIIARELSNEEATWLYYAKLEKKADFAIEFTMADSVLITGKGSEKNDVVNGEYTLAIAEESDANYSDLLEIKFDDLRCDDEKVTGKITVTPDLSMFDDSGMLDLKLVLEIDSTEKAGAMKIKVLNAGLELGTLTFKAEVSGKANVTRPDDSAILDEEAWTAKIDIEKLYENLKNAGIPEEIITLIDEELFGSDDYYEDDYYEDYYYDDYYDEYYDDGDYYFDDEYSEGI